MQYICKKPVQISHKEYFVDITNKFTQLESEVNNCEKNVKGEANLICNKFLAVQNLWLWQGNKSEFLLSHYCKSFVVSETDEINASYFAQPHFWKKIEVTTVFRMSIVCSQIIQFCTVEPIVIFLFLNIWLVGREIMEILYKFGTVLYRTGARCSVFG